MSYKDMKVLIISTTKFDLDGITNVILNYYRAMDKSDMQVDFVIPNEIRDDLKLELEFFGSHIYKISGRNSKPWSYVNRLAKLIRENNYDIVHAHGNSCTLTLEMYAAKTGGVKVRIPHSHNSTCKHKIVHKLLRRPFDSCYTQAFACGEKAGDWLYGTEAFEIINNGIEISNYKYNVGIRQKYREKYKLNEKMVIGHVGNFNYQKNHEYLIEIFAELFKSDRNYRLMLIGDGELKPNIEKQVKDLGLSGAVIFIGKTLDVHQFLQAMDMMVMPSRFEGLPLTLVEAQSACLSCFVSDIVSKEAAITDLVKFISLEKSPKEWANIINESNIINRDERKEEICNEIINAGYSINENAKKMKLLYEEYAKLN